jgi:hypothetical protein
VGGGDTVRLWRLVAVADWRLGGTVDGCGQRQAQLQAGPVAGREVGDVQLAVVAGLYRLPLAEFVAACDRLVRQLWAAGDRSAPSRGCGGLSPVGPKGLSA